jgi:acyl-CoA thioester hydrolase
MSEPLDGFPIIIDVPVAWGEMDAFRHVNNIVFFRYFESARMAYLAAIGFTGEAGVGPILASTRCRFRRPLEHPDSVRVGARTTEVATDRFTMEYVVVSRAQGAVAAEGAGVVVAYDYATRSRTVLPAEVRQRIAQLEGRAERDPGAGPGHDAPPA